ncbi:hypothetical protein CRG98_025770 [Punica granatum]|uniref:Retrotransposon gag domain-containing protein n=1 Tax=Punica granatum TaxID=22663 RepID=A0A2I0JC69_PUNGR|nr:hypothetical protein CRG98_025770 [Punica granatum]
MFPYSSNLIDKALAQVILQVVGGHSYVEAILAETIWSLDYVRHLRMAQILQALQADIPDAESSVQGAMRTELQSIREERDRLRGELVKTRSELTDQRELQGEQAQVRAHVTSQDREIARLSAMLDRVRAKAHKAPSNAIDLVHFTALEGMVNQLAANMNTNMAELMTMLRDQNRASSSYTPPPERRTTADQNPVVPPIYVTDSEDIYFLQRQYIPAVHPVNDPLPLPLAPTAIKILDFNRYDGTKDPRHHLRHYQRKMLQYWDYEEFVIQTFQDSIMGSALDWFMTLKAVDIPTWAELSQKFLDQYRFCAEAPPTLSELCTMEMNENQAFEAYASEWRGKSMRIVQELYFTEYPTDEERIFSATAAYVAQFHPQGLAHVLHLRMAQILRAPQADIPDTESSVQGAMRTELQSIREERDRLRRELVKTRSELTDQKKLQGELAQAPSNAIDPVRFTVLEGMVNQLAANMNTNMAELMTMLRDQNQASSSYIPPLERRTNADPNPVVPPNYVTDTPPSLNIPPSESGTPTQAAPAAPPINIPPEMETEQERRMRRMEETIRALQASTSRPNYGDSNWNLFPGMRLPPKIKILDFKRHMRIPCIMRHPIKHRRPIIRPRRSSFSLNRHNNSPQSKAEPRLQDLLSWRSELQLRKLSRATLSHRANVIKASEYKVVEHMGKSAAHISLLALLLSSDPHRNALLKVLTVAQVPKETTPERIEEIMNVDMSRIRASKMNVRAFDGSRREVNGEIDLLIDVGPCLFSVTFQILEIPNAFSLLLGRPWIHAAGAVPSSLHQKLKFFAKGELITVNGEEDYAIYKETAIPYAQGILQPVEMEEYRNRRGLDFRPSCHEIVQARRGKHLHRLATHYGKLSKGSPFPPLSHFFPGPPHVVGSTPEDSFSESEDSSSDTAEASLHYQPFMPSQRRHLLGSIYASHKKMKS